MVTKSHARAAAGTATAILAVLAGFHFYWALGGTWAGGGEPPPYEPSELASIGLACLVYAGVLLIRVGYWHEHMPAAVARFADLNAWVIIIIPFGGAIQAFTATDDPVGGTLDMIIAALASVVVRSERPVSPEPGSADAERQAQSPKLSPLEQVCRPKRPPLGQPCGGRGPLQLSQPSVTLPPADMEATPRSVV